MPTGKLMEHLPTPEYLPKEACLWGTDKSAGEKADISWERKDSWWIWQTHIPAGTCRSEIMWPTFLWISTLLDWSRGSISLCECSYFRKREPGCCAQSFAGMISLNFHNLRKRKRNLHFSKEMNGAPEKLMTFPMEHRLTRGCLSLCNTIQS